MSEESAVQVEATNVKKRMEEREREMSRSEVKELFKSWGIEEPTDEQVTNYLNTISKEVKSAEDKAMKYKAQADKALDLEKQLDELNSQNLSELEKSQKATDEANAKVQALEQTVKTMQLQKSLAEIGITGDDAVSLVGEDGSLNTEKLGEILNAREKAAVATYQKQALDSTPSANGGKEEEPEKPYKDIVDRVTASKKTETEAVNIIDSYIKN